MKYLKTFESLYESPLIIELKDMALELTDVGFKVEIFKDGTNTTNNIIVIIILVNVLLLFVRQFFSLHFLVLVRLVA